METHVYRDSNGHMKTRQDKVVTFRQSNYLQITGFYDTTPPLYVKVFKSLIYLELNSTVTWLGQSEAIIAELRKIAYQQNYRRDRHCKVELRTNVPGLTEHNYLKQGEVPCWISPVFLYLSMFLQFDAAYLCLVRAFVPTTYLTVTKHATIEPNGLQLYQANQEPKPVNDSIPLPAIDYDQMCKPTVDAISLPPVLQENT